MICQRMLPARVYNSPTEQAIFFIEVPLNNA